MAIKAYSGGALRMFSQRQDLRLLPWRTSASAANVEAGAVHSKFIEEGRADGIGISSRVPVVRPLHLHQVRSPSLGLIPQSREEFALPQAVLTLFRQAYAPREQGGQYVPDKCHDNAVRLMKVVHRAGIPSEAMRIALMKENGTPLRAANTRNGQITWGSHGALELLWQGRRWMLDLDQPSPMPIAAEEYFRRCFGEDLEHRTPSSDLLVKFVPAQALLDDEDSLWLWWDREANRWLDKTELEWQFDFDTEHPWWRFNADYLPEQELASWPCFKMAPGYLKLGERIAIGSEMDVYAFSEDPEHVALIWSGVSVYFSQSFFVGQFESAQLVEFAARLEKRIREHAAMDQDKALVYGGHSIAPKLGMLLANYYRYPYGYTVESVAGEALDAMIAEGALADAEIDEVFRQLSEQLAILHARGFHHGDPRPWNARVRREEGEIVARWVHFATDLSEDREARAVRDREIFQLARERALGH